MKKCLVIGLVVLGGLYVCKKTNLPSYATTLWCQSKESLRRQVPREFEIDRMRQQIARLDDDVRALRGPVAEKTVEVKELQERVQTAHVNLKQQREDLLALTSKVESESPSITWQGRELTLAKAKQQLARDFAAFRRNESTLKSQEKHLEALEKNLQAAREQFARIKEQKEEFELALVQLEAEEASLRLEKISTPPPEDKSRIADIKSGLDAIRRGQRVEREVVELERQSTTIQTDHRSSGATAVDPAEIRAHIEGKKISTKVAASK